MSSRRTRLSPRRLIVESLETRLVPATISGHVYVDFNNDGVQDFNESAIGGTTVTLTGKDSQGNTVTGTVVTDVNGDYSFTALPASDAAGYTIIEAQPAAYRDGRDVLGTVGGVFVGSGTVNDKFSGIVVSLSADGSGYNFGERPVNTTLVSAGQSAPITFWAGTSGQNLINAVNGGPSATQLGNWLAATFPNLYASCAGQTNTQVAATFTAFYNLTTATAPPGPADTDAQMMATALACYVTSSILAGNTAAAYGFQVTTYGLGVRTHSVGLDGAAFQVAANSVVAVFDLLLTVNRQSHNGLLYDNSHNGTIEYPEDSYRRQVRVVCKRINDFGLLPPVRVPSGGRI